MLVYQWFLCEITSTFSLGIKQCRFEVNAITLDHGDSFRYLFCQNSGHGMRGVVELGWNNDQTIRENYISTTNE
jgi:hypothetical protein